MTSHELMMERLIQAGMTRGRREMANLSYGMARACAKVAEGEHVAHLRLFIEPRSVLDQRADMARISKRLGERLEMEVLPAADPLGDQAVPAGHACLQFTESLEGSTPRVQYARATLARISGDDAGAADMLRHMLKTPLSRRKWKQVQEGLQHALFGCQDYESIISIGKQLMQDRTPSPWGCFNVLAAYTWTGMRQQFHVDAPRFAQSLIGVPDPAFWVRLLQREADAFARTLGLDPADVLSLMPEQQAQDGRRELP